MSRTAPRYLRGTAIGLTYLLGLLAAAGATFGALPIKVRLVLGVAAAALIYVAVWWHAAEAQESEPDGHNSEEPDLTPVVDHLSERITDMLAKTDYLMAIRVFAEITVQPETYQSRIVETLSLEARNVTRSVSIEYSLPAELFLARGKTIFLPVALFYKGELLDKLDLRGEHGTPIPSLNDGEGRHLVAAGLRQLLHKIFGDETAVSKRACEAEKSLLRIILRRGPMRDHRRAHSMRSEIDEVFATLAAAASQEGSNIDFSDKRQQELRKYVSTLASTYVVIGALPAEAQREASQDAYGNVRVFARYTHTLVPRPLSAGAGDKIRALLGLRPYQVSIPADLSSKCGSYHLVAQGPPDQYVASQSFACRVCHKRAKPNWQSRDGTGVATIPEGDCLHMDTAGPPSSAWHFRVRPRRGQEYAHLYVRSNTHKKLRGTEFVVRFAEAPPGVTDRAFLVAAVLTVLAWAVGHHLSVTTAGSLHRTVLSAIFLPPSLGAVWFGIASDSDSVLRTSAAARLSLMASGSLCVAAAAFLLAGNYDGRDLRIDVLGVSRLVWVVLFALALANALVISCNLMLKYRRFYRHRPSRNDSNFDIAWR